MRFYKPTQTVLRYRMKREPEILEIVVTTLVRIATPIAWNDKGEAIAWHIELQINEWLFLAVHDVCDFHEFVVEEV